MTIFFDIYILAATTLIGFITYKKKDLPHLRLLRFFLLFDVTCDTVNYILARHSIRNVAIVNFYSIIELSFFLYFLRETISGAAIKKKIRLLQFAFPALCVANTLFLQGPNQFQSYTFLLGCLALVSLGVIYIYRLFKHKESIDLLHEPAFWINVGVIFFFTAALSIVGVQNYLTTLPRNITIAVGILTRIVASFFYIFLIIAFVCQRRTHSPK